LCLDLFKDPPVVEGQDNFTSLIDTALGLPLTQIHLDGTHYRDDEKYENPI
jgi:hypothetical protein